MKSVIPSFGSVPMAMASRSMPSIWLQRISMSWRASGIFSNSIAGAMLAALENHLDQPADVFVPRDAFDAVQLADLFNFV